MDSRGITTAGRGRDAGTRLLSWDEIKWFRDGWHAPESGKPGWVLQVVMADGGVEPVTETWTAGAKKATPEMLSLVRRAATEHSVPAVLTGDKVSDGLPGDGQFRFRTARTPTLFYDPAGQPGLREWTGTQWSPFVQVDPGASGPSGQETGLTRIWSPLSAAELQRQSDAIRRSVRTDTTVVLVSGAGLALFLAVFTVRLVSHHGDGRMLGGDISVLFFLAGCVLAGWSLWTSKRISLALSAAARASGQDAD